MKNLLMFIGVFTISIFAIYIILDGVFETDNIRISISILLSMFHSTLFEILSELKKLNKNNK